MMKFINPINVPVRSGSMEKNVGRTYKLTIKIIVANSNKKR